ncbi:MAG: O-antigen ligase family protein [Xanthobacteraceae bacterium]
MSERALAAAYAGGEDEAAPAALPQRLLNVVLFVTVLTSSIAFIEPSPHDGLMIILLATCVAARVRFDRKIAPLMLLLAIWLFGAFFSLIPVIDQKQTIQYVITSAYLVVAAIMFACLFCDGDPVRLVIVRRAYIIAALIATAAGYIGFFHLLPGSDIFLANDRVSATFKDPNVYGPFLIFPLLLLLIGFLTRGLRLSGLAIMIFLFGGLLLSFSRGAWAHFAVSATVAIALLLAAAPEPRMRTRILLFSIAALVVMALFVVALMSIGSVHDLFLERAKAIQPYDIGPGGRFWEQRLALGVILEHPNGLGPFEFFRLYGTQQHDVYMQAFLVYGWVGGVAYFTLVTVTLAVGFRSALIPAPWQIYLIAAYAAFVGEAFEGFIVDTDHWRHFFLILGLVWGLTAASINLRRSEAWRSDFDARPQMLPSEPHATFGAVAGPPKK